MSWSTSSRRQRLPADWDSVIVPEVKRRAGGRCQKIKESTGRRCTNAGRDVDHKSDPDDHSYSNLWLLCQWHHKPKTQLEAQQGKQAKKNARKRPITEQHPGIIRRAVH